MDLSKYAKDKDAYILRTEINEDFSKFKVIYASGREEEFDFSIHNYQVYLYRMEEQYKEYSEYYKREIGMDFSKERKNAILISLLEIVSIFVSCNLDIAIAGRIVLVFIALLGIIKNYSDINSAKIKLGMNAMKTAIVDYYLENKEKYGFDIKDPKTGNQERWYTVDLNNIDRFDSIFELSFNAIPLSFPEVRESLGEMLSKDINGKTMSLK